MIEQLGNFAWIAPLDLHIEFDCFLFELSDQFTEQLGSHFVPLVLGAKFDVGQKDAFVVFACKCQPLMGLAVQQ